MEIFNGVILSSSIDITGISTGITYNIRTVSTSQTILTDDYTIVCTTGLTLTLPTAIGVQGKLFSIKSKTNDTITINTTGGQTIDDESTITITLKNQSLTLQSDGSNWVLI